MTKTELIDFISDKADIAKVKADTIVSTIFDSMVDALLRGERIEIRGFGTFQVRRYDAYHGRNPRTGAVIEVGEKKLPHFKAGKELRDSIQAKTSKLGAGIK